MSGIAAFLVMRVFRGAVRDKVKDRETILLGEHGPETSPRRTIQIDWDTGLTSDARIWSGGDAAKGPRTLIDAIAEAVRCKERGARRALPLPVSAPFHSPLMAPAREGLEPFTLAFAVAGVFALAGQATAALFDFGLLIPANFLLFALLGGALAGAPSWTNEMPLRWTGPAMLPQAGVAMGMALVASSRFPEYQQVLLTVVISSTVFFEIIGPVFTRAALRRTG